MIVLSATGTARKRTLPALERSSVVDVVAIHGRQPDRLSAIAEEYGISHVDTDFERILDKVECDLVFVASPPHLHQAHVAAALARHKAVLCEKPLALTVREAQAMAEHARTQGVLLRVAHHLRHQPATSFIRELVCSRILGEPRMCSMKWGFFLNEDASNAAWKLDPVHPAGPMLDVGVHVIDMALHLFGLPTRSTHSSSLDSRFGSVPDGETATLRYSSGLVVHIATSHSTPFSTNALEIDFENGSVTATSFFGEASTTTVVVHSREGVTQEHFEPVNPYRVEVEDFARELVDGVPNVGTSAEEALAALRIAAPAR